MPRLHLKYQVVYHRTSIMLSKAPMLRLCLILCLRYLEVFYQHTRRNLLIMWWTGSRDAWSWLWRMNDLIININSKTCNISNLSKIFEAIKILWYFCISVKLRYLGFSQYTCTLGKVVLLARNHRFWNWRFFTDCLNGSVAWPVCLKTCLISYFQGKLTL